MNKKELEERLIDFAVLVVEISDQTPTTKAGNHLAGQIIRSGTSPALNYGEAQSAESKKDFIHKLGIILKELRETRINLIIMKRTKLYQNESLVVNTLKESNELISIFVKSIETSKKNLKS